MADTKISALTALAAADLATDDVFAIVDTGAATTKKITVESLAESAALGRTVIGIACSDETTAIDATGEKASFRMPFAFTLTAVRAHLTSACATGTFTVDINEAGTSVLSTKLTIDATELTSTTAATAAVISDSAIADDAEITIDVDNVANSTGTGLKVFLIGVRNV